jgi:hypothetical protein
MPYAPKNTIIIDRFESVLKILTYYRSYVFHVLKYLKISLYNNNDIYCIQLLSHHCHCIFDDRTHVWVFERTWLAWYWWTYGNSTSTGSIWIGPSSYISVDQQMIMHMIYISILIIFRIYFILVMSDFECTGLSYFFSPLKNTVDNPTSTQMYQNSKMKCRYMPYKSINTIIMIFGRFFIPVTIKLSVTFLRF